MRSRDGWKGAAEASRAKVVFFFKGREVEEVERGKSDRANDDDDDESERFPLLRVLVRFAFFFSAAPPRRNREKGITHPPLSSYLFREEKEEEKEREQGCFVVSNRWILMGHEKKRLSSLFPLFFTTHGLHDARSVTGPALGCAKL